MFAERIDMPEAKRRLLAEKQPSLQFTTPEQLGELALFLCGSAGDNVRGVAWAVDGGWTAQ
jgi:3-hydroxybutyrate dehydrogenase